MADQAVTPITLTPNVATAAVGGLDADLTAANDGVVTVDKGSLLIYLFDAGGAGGTVLIKAGDDAIKESQGDITVTLGASEAKLIRVETARVKALSGTDKGKIRIDASANTTCWAVEVP